MTATKCHLIARPPVIRCCDDSGLCASVVLWRLTEFFLETGVKIGLVAETGPGHHLHDRQIRGSQQGRGKAVILRYSRISLIHIASARAGTLKVTSVKWLSTQLAH